MATAQNHNLDWFIGSGIEDVEALNKAQEWYESLPKGLDIPADATS